MNSCKLNNTNINVLLPKDYKEINIFDVLNNVNEEDFKGAKGYQKETCNSNNFIFVSKCIYDNTYNFNDTNKLINDINNNLDDKDILIKVDKGITVNNYSYIYSIVKHQDLDELCNKYLLIMYLGNKEDCICVNGVFNEIGTTGQRDTIGLEFARRAGLISIDINDLKTKWSYNPYNPNKKDGVLMNLSEKEGLDGIFVDHPLSQLRELIVSITDNKYLGKINRNTNIDEKELLKSLFVDECIREKIDIES